MIQYRIGLIGAENSHADIFSREINLPDENGNMRYPDCRITMVYGHYPEDNQRVAQRYNIETIAGRVEEMIGQVDAVVITARDGKYHYEFAEPFVERGIPCFVDKPFTVDPEQTRQLIALAKKKNVPLCGGSSVKFDATTEEMARFVAEYDGEIFGGNFHTPLEPNSEYSGWFFYSSHLIEMMLEVFGYDPRSVVATQNPKGVCAIFNYEQFSVTGNFNESHNADYGISVFHKNGTEYKHLVLRGSGEKEVADFIHMIRTGEMLRSYDTLAIPVACMNAVKKAYETGTCVDIDMASVLG